MSHTFTNHEFVWFEEVLGHRIAIGHEVLKISDNQPGIEPAANACRIDNPL